MVERRPVKIRDKNGKGTTVYRRVDESPSNTRSAGTPAPRLAEQNRRYADDLNDTFKDVNRIINGHPLNMNQIISLDAEREDGKGFDRHNEMLAVYTNAAELWNIATDNAESLDELQREYRESLVQLMRGTQQSDATIAAYDTLLRNVDELQPVAKEDDYVPRRGRRDISDADKSKIGSLIDIGGMADRYGFSLGGEDDDLVEVNTAAIGGVINSIASWNRVILSDQHVDEIATEFFGDQLDGMRFSELEHAKLDLVFNRGDLRGFLIEIGVTKGVSDVS